MTTSNSNQPRESSQAAQSFDPWDILRSHMAANGLKASRQRDTIAETFFGVKGHTTVDELLVLVREQDSNISQATIYRTMRLLSDCHLAVPRNFDGQTRYEMADGPDEHHDHLICTQCQKIIEFVDERVEKLQDEIAESMGFRLTQHKMELYGICPDCLRE